MLERRFLDACELRLDGDGDAAPRINGYAARFNKWSEKIWGLFREKIAPGAFAKTIGEADIRALWNHDSNFVLGRNRSETLTVAEDEKGLAVDVAPPDTQWARDLMTSMKRGDVNQMSFGFQTVRDEWNEKGDERTLIEVKLFDVSVVTFPAYPQTSAAVRSTVPVLEIDEYLAALSFRARRGIRPTSEELALAHASVDECLLGYLPAEETSAPAPAPASSHPGDGAPAAGHPPEGRSVSLLKARLRTLERELTL